MPSLLIVDDEKTIRNTLGTLLREEGYAVETASSGTQALRLMRSQPDQAIAMKQRTSESNLSARRWRTFSSLSRRPSRD